MIVVIVCLIVWLLVMLSVRNSVCLLSDVVMCVLLFVLRLRIVMYVLVWFRFCVIVVLISVVLLVMSVILLVRVFMECFWVLWGEGRGVLVCIC